MPVCQPCRRRPPVVLVHPLQTSVSTSAAGVEALVAKLSQAMAAAEAPLAAAGTGHNGSGGHAGSHASHVAGQHSYW